MPSMEMNKFMHWLFENLCAGLAHQAVLAASAASLGRQAPGKRCQKAESALRPNPLPLSNPAIFGELCILDRRLRWAEAACSCRQRVQAGSCVYQTWEKTPPVTFPKGCSCQHFLLEFFFPEHALDDVDAGYKAYHRLTDSPSGPTYCFYPVSS